MAGPLGTDKTSSPQRPFLLHYTQGKWTKVKPSTNTNGSGPISMISANDGWAAAGSDYYTSQPNSLGVSYLFHYNGQQWTTVPALSLPNQLVSFYDLQMLSTTEGWGVGESTTYSSQHDSQGASIILSWKAVIVHYHNGVWSIVPTP